MSSVVSILGVEACSAWEERKGWPVIRRQKLQISILAQPRNGRRDAYAPVACGSHRPNWITLRSKILVMDYNSRVYKTKQCMILSEKVRG